MLKIAAAATAAGIRFQGFFFAFHFRILLCVSSHCSNNAFLLIYSSLTVLLLVFFASSSSSLIHFQYCVFAFHASFHINIRTYIHYADRVSASLENVHVVDTKNDEKDLVSGSKLLSVHVLFHFDADLNGFLDKHLLYRCECTICIYM
jgi:hypothetical protein